MKTHYFLFDNLAIMLNSIFIKLKATPIAITVAQVLIKLSILDKFKTAYPTDDKIITIPTQSVIFEAIDAIRLLFFIFFKLRGYITNIVKSNNKTGLVKNKFH